MTREHDECVKKGKIKPFSRGVAHNSHYCLIAAIKALYVETRHIPVFFLEGLQEAKDLREEADYYNKWSQAGCEKLLKVAEEFLHKAERLIKK